MAARLGNKGHITFSFIYSNYNLIWTLNFWSTMNNIHGDSKSVLIHQKKTPAVRKILPKLRQRVDGGIQHLFFHWQEPPCWAVFHCIARCSVVQNQQTRSGNTFHIFGLGIANDLNYDTVGFLCVLCPIQTMEKNSEHSFEKYTMFTVKITQRQETGWIKMGPNQRRTFP